MIERGPATADEMVLAFVRGDIESLRFAKHYARALRFIEATRSQLIDQADLSNPAQNLQCSYLLERVRGYGRNALLFEGLPIDIAWRRVSVTPAELGSFSYMNFVTWLRLTNATRLISDGAANIGKVETAKEMATGVAEIAARIERSETFPPLITVQSASGRIILVDGQIRATAYVLANAPPDIEMLVGTSPLINHWRYF
jgi:hypothetical protein